MGQDFGRSKLPLPSLSHSCSLQRCHERFHDPFEHRRTEEVAKGRGAGVRERWQTLFGRLRIDTEIQAQLAGDDGLRLE
jgi:hypothetical protein